MFYPVLNTLGGVFVAGLMIAVVHYRVRCYRYRTLLTCIAKDRKTVVSKELEVRLRDLSR